MGATGNDNWSTAARKGGSGAAFTPPSVAFAAGDSNRRTGAFANLANAQFIGDAPQLRGAGVAVRDVVADGVGTAEREGVPVVLLVGGPVVDGVEVAVDVIDGVTVAVCVADDVSELVGELVWEGDAVPEVVPSGESEVVGVSDVVVDGVAVGDSDAVIGGLAVGVSEVVSELV